MISSLEIRKLEFNKKMSGYDTAEVRSALESIAKEMETIQRDNTVKSEELAAAQERLSHFRLIEKTLQDSVLTMQTTLEEKRRSADHEAQLIIHEARQRAHEELSDYTERVRRLRDEIEYLENQKRNHFIRFKHFCLSQLEWLKSMENTDEQPVNRDPRSAPSQQPMQQSVQQSSQQPMNANIGNYGTSSMGTTPPPMR